MGNSTSSNLKQTQIKKTNETNETNGTNKNKDIIEEPKTNKPLEKLLAQDELNKSKQEQDTTDILDGITEIEQRRAEHEKSNSNLEQKGGNRKQIPMLGGYKNNLLESSDNDMYGYGLENKTGRKRYTKYDLFKILRDLDVETEADLNNIRGGEGIQETQETKEKKPNESDSDNSSLNDEKSMAHIKNVILKELETLKTNKSKQMGGNGCGCGTTNTGADSGVKTNSRKSSSKLNLNNVVVEGEENKQMGGMVIIDASSSSTTSDESTSSSSSSSSSSELGKKKKSKGKKLLKKKETETSDSRFFIETSESGISNDHLNDSEDENTSNGENDDLDEKKHKSESEEGLSIFPFNSSDVKSSLSIKNYRMLRRKI